MASRGIHKQMVIMCLALAVLLSLQPSTARLLRPTGNDTGRGSADVGNTPQLVKESVVDKYAPLLLAMLPRGTVPPSGPSGGTNDVPGN